MGNPRMPVVPGAIRNPTHECWVSGASYAIKRVRIFAPSTQPTNGPYCFIPLSAWRNDPTTNWVDWLRCGAELPTRLAAEIAWMIAIRLP